METLDNLKKTLDTSKSIKQVVSTMKALSGANIKKYEKIVQVLYAYRSNIELALQALMMYNDVNINELDFVKNSKDKKEYAEEELTKMINSYDPPAIKDWPKIPYKTIVITFLLFFSSILFIYTGVKKYKENEKWTSWLSYTALGGLLSIPGFYYTFYIVCILLKVKGYEYEDLPDLSDN